MGPVVDDERDDVLGNLWQLRSERRGEVLAVFLFVPIVAYSYGTVSRSFLKLIKIE